MIRRSGAYYLSLVKEFYTNMAQETNKDVLIVQTTVKGFLISFDLAFLSQIASIPNEGPNITFGSPSRINFGGTEQNHASVCGRVGIHNCPNFGNSLTI